MASDSIEQDEFGRWNERVYRLGEKMAWFTEEDEDHAFWMTYGKPVEGLLPYEFCWGTCPSCAAKFYARIELENVRAMRISGKLIWRPTGRPIPTCRWIGTPKYF